LVDSRCFFSLAAFFSQPKQALEGAHEAAAAAGAGSALGREPAGSRRLASGARAAQGQKLPKGTGKVLEKQVLVVLVLDDPGVKGRVLWILIGSLG
jgi:hypothetical protein